MWVIMVILKLKMSLYWLILNARFCRSLGNSFVWLSYFLKIKEGAAQDINDCKTRAVKRTFHKS